MGDLWQQMDSMMQEVPMHEKLIFTGDMNEHVGKGTGVGN